MLFATDPLVDPLDFPMLVG